MLSGLVVGLLGASPAPAEVPAEVPIQRPSEPASLALDWRTSAGCLDRAAVVERVRALVPELPAELPERGLASLRVTAVVEHDARGAEPWQVELTLVTASGEGTRRFAAAACEEAVAATVLVVAIALDPVATATSLHDATARREPTPEPTPTPEATPTPSLEPASTPSLEPASASASEGAGERLVLDDRGSLRAPRVGLRVHAGAGVGPIRAAQGVVGASVALFDRRWRWELAASGSIPRVVRFEDGRAARFDAWSIATRGCFVPSRGAFEFPVCPGVEVGQVRGRGLAPTTNPERRGVLWLAPSLAQGFTWAPLDRLAIGVELALVVPLTRASFVIGERELQRVALVGARALVGVELRLP